MPEPLYDQTIRDLLPDVVGARIIEMLQHDPDDFAETGEHLIDLCLDSGAILRINLDEGSVSYLPLDDTDDPDDDETGAVDG